MRVENLPYPVDASLYQEAIEAFWDTAQAYIVSLYTAGNINFPGLSDLDLILIPRDRYLAPLHLRATRRLPQRFQAILHHEPFIVPLEEVEIFRYSFLSNLKLRYGPPLLEDVRQDNSMANQLCTALEGLFSYLLFLDRQKRGEAINAAYCLPIFSSLRFTIQILVDLGLMQEGNYQADFDLMRQEFIETGSEKCILAMFRYFEEALNRCAAAVAVALRLDPRQGEQIRAFYKRDRFPLARLYRPDIEERYAAISAYFKGLAARNFHYGHLFKPELYPSFPISKWFYPLIVANQMWQRLQNCSRPSLAG